MMTMNHIDHKVGIFEEGEIRQLDRFEIGSYKVDRITVFKNNKIEWKSFSIYGEGEYVPEIYYEDGFWTDKKPEFKIQTTAYGAKGIEEIEKIMNGYQEAIEVVKVLTMNFC